MKKLDPYENRTKCRSCGKKGYLKIIDTYDKNPNKTISEYLHFKSRGTMMSFCGETFYLDCTCSYCNDFNTYPIENGLFVDGVIKEI